MNICLWCETSPGLGINGLRQKAHPGGAGQGWVGVAWFPSNRVGALSGGQSRNGLESLSLEGYKMVAGRQVSVPSLLTFKIVYTQAPICNSLTLVLQCSLQQEAQLQPTPIRSSKPWLQCPLPWEVLSVSPG